MRARSRATPGFGGLKLIHPFHGFHGRSAPSREEPQVRDPERVPEDGSTFFLVDNASDVENRMRDIAAEVVQQAERKAELSARTRFR
jgi:hypothetical protein